MDQVFSVEEREERIVHSDGSSCISIILSLYGNYIVYVHVHAKQYPHYTSLQELHGILWVSLV